MPIEAREICSGQTDYATSAYGRRAIGNGSGAGRFTEPLCASLGTGIQYPTDWIRENQLSTNNLLAVAYTFERVILRREGTGLVFVKPEVSAADMFYFTFCGCARDNQAFVGDIMAEAMFDELMTPASINRLVELFTCSVDGHGCFNSANICYQLSKTKSLKFCLIFGSLMAKQAESLKIQQLMLDIRGQGNRYREAQRNMQRIAQDAA